VSPTKTASTNGRKTYGIVDSAQPSSRSPSTLRASKSTLIPRRLSEVAIPASRESKKLNGNASTISSQQILEFLKKKRRLSQEGPEPRDAKVARTKHGVKSNAGDIHPAEVKGTDSTSNGQRNDSVSHAATPLNTGVDRRDSGVLSSYEAMLPHKDISPSVKQGDETSNSTIGIRGDKKHPQKPASDGSEYSTTKVVKTSAGSVLPSIGGNFVADSRLPGTHALPGPDSSSSFKPNAPLSTQSFQPVASEHLTSIDSSTFPRWKGSTTCNLDKPFVCDSTAHTPLVPAMRRPNTNLAERK